MSIIWYGLIALGVALAICAGTGVVPLAYAAIGLAAVAFATSISLIALNLASTVPAHVGENWFRVLVVLRKFVFGR